MQPPNGVNQAITAIWITIVLGVILEFYEKFVGTMSSGALIISLAIYALLCIVPFKLAKKSNVTRYVYLIVDILLLLLSLPILTNAEKFPFEFIVIALSIPIEIFIFYKLFQKEASIWFSSK